MTEVQKKFSFFSEGAAKIDTIKRDAYSQAAPMAYRGLGVTRPVIGDGSFPYFKDPPEVSPALDYLENQQLPSVATIADYVNGAEIDTSGVRRLTAVINTKRLGAAAGALSVLPEMGYRRQGTLLWVPLGVTDTTLTVPGVFNGYAERGVFQTELTWDPDAQQSPPPTVNGTFNLALVFDVTDFQSYRLRFGARGAALQLSSVRITATR